MTISRSNAQRVLRRIQGADGPTPERLMRAEGGARVETFAEFGDGDDCKIVQTRRIRVTPDPLGRLAARMMLAPDDPAENARLQSAGEAYRSLWLAAGLSPLRSPTMERSGASGLSGELIASERQAQAFNRYSAAAAGLAISGRRPVVDAIVLQERELADVARGLFGFKDEKQARAVALHDLRMGLKCLT